MSSGKGRGESEGRLTDPENQVSLRVARVWVLRNIYVGGEGSWSGVWKGWGRGG